MDGVISHKKFAVVTETVMVGPAMTTVVAVEAHQLPSLISIVLNPMESLEMLKIVPSIGNAITMFQFIKLAKFVSFLKKTSKILFY
jgi:hypothetical protein